MAGRCDAHLAVVLAKAAEGRALRGVASEMSGAYSPGPGTSSGGGLPMSMVRRTEVPKPPVPRFDANPADAATRPVLQQPHVHPRAHSLSAYP